MKRIVTVQDISCLGKCSLTVALPLISAMGVECAILPTAVLSTHTMFSGFTCCDLTSEFRPIAAHWKQEKLGFDGIYTGYLGTIEQIDMVKELIGRDLPGGKSVFTVKFEVKDVAELDAIRNKLLNIRDVVGSRRGQN